MGALPHPHRGPSRRLGGGSGGVWPASLALIGLTGCWGGAGWPRTRLGGAIGGRICGGGVGRVEGAPGAGLGGVKGPLEVGRPAPHPPISLVARLQRAS